VTADGVDELMGGARQIGFPAMMNLLDSAGSIHVTRVDDLSQLREAYARAAISYARR
jgi:biotin carboxylase